MTLTDKPRLITLAEWRTLTPKQQGYILYWQGEQSGSELKGEKNPWPQYSQQYKDFQEGERLAMLDAQDSEE